MFPKYFEFFPVKHLFQGKISREILKHGCIQMLDIPKRNSDVYFILGNIILVMGDVRGLTVGVKLRMHNVGKTTHNKSCIKHNTKRATNERKLLTNSKSNKQTQRQNHQ